MGINVRDRIFDMVNQESSSIHHDWNSSDYRLLRLGQRGIPGRPVANGDDAVRSRRRGTQFFLLCTFFRFKFGMDY